MFTHHALVYLIDASSFAQIMESIILASREATLRIAEQINAQGTFDAVIHNTGVGYREPWIETVVVWNMYLLSTFLLPIFLLL